MRSIAVALVALLALITPAGAQSPQPGPSFVLDAISAYAGHRVPLHIVLTVSNAGAIPLGDASIHIILHGRVGSRSELRQALDGNPRGDVLVETTEQLATPLQPGERRPVDIQRDVETLTNVFHSPFGDGVYPVEIALRSGGNTLEDVVTAEPFFYQPPPATGRLNVVWIDPIHRPAAFDAQGAYPAGTIDADVQPNGLLGGSTAPFTQHPTLPVTLAVTGMTLDQARAIAGGYRSITRKGSSDVPATAAVPVAARAFLSTLHDVASATAVQIASTSYARADIVGLVANGMGGELTRQIDQGDATVRDALGRAPSQDLFVPSDFQLDARSATAIAAHGFSTVVVAPEALPPRQSLFGYDAPVTLAASGTVTLTGFVVDPAIRDRLATQTDPILAAQGVIAETAGSFFERPALASTRVLVVASPQMLSPHTASELAGKLALTPWVRMATPADVLSGPGALAPTPDKVPLATAPVAKSRALAEAAGARRESDALAKVLVDRGSPLDVIERYILSSESVDWSAAPSRGVALAVAGRDIAARTLSRIRSPSRQVTLTSRVAQIPVTILNDTQPSQPVRVRVRLESAKVTFPSGAAQTIEVSQRVATVTFRSETRVTGSFPLRVVLETPDGTTAFGEGTIVVRSTAVSAVTLAATGGGFILLLISWFRRFLRDRRAKAGAGAG